MLFYRRLTRRFSIEQRYYHHGSIGVPFVVVRRKKNVRGTIELDYRRWLTIRLLDLDREYYHNRGNPLLTVSFNK